MTIKPNDMSEYAKSLERIKSARLQTVYKVLQENNAINNDYFVFLTKLDNFLDRMVSSENDDAVILQKLETVDIKAYGVSAEFQEYYCDILKSSLSRYNAKKVPYIIDLELLILFPIMQDYYPDAVKRVFREKIQHARKVRKKKDRIEEKNRQLLLKVSGYGGSSYFDSYSRSGDDSYNISSSSSNTGYQRSHTDYSSHQDISNPSHTDDPGYGYDSCHYDQSYSDHSDNPSRYHTDY